MEVNGNKDQMATDLWLRCALARYVSNMAGVTVDGEKTRGMLELGWR